MRTKHYLLGVLAIILGIALFGNMMEKGFDNLGDKTLNIISDIKID